MTCPNMIEPWDSRFTDSWGKRQYEAHRTAYLAKVRPCLEAELICLQELKQGKISAVTNNQRLYATATADVIKKGATEAQNKRVTTVFAKLAKSETEKTVADDILESHQSGMEDKLSGKKDPETMEWIRNIEVINKSNEASKAAFIGELMQRFDPKPDKWWEEVRNGSNRKSKRLALSICQMLAYYDQYFSEAELSLIFGVVADNHNTKLAIDKLTDLRIVRKTTDDRGSEVYILVDMLKMHLRYEEDAEVEKSIGKDLKRLYRDGNDIINARKQKRNDNDTIVQNSEREEEKEDEEKENNDKDVQTSESEEEEEEQYVYPV